MVVSRKQHPLTPNAAVIINQSPLEKVDSYCYLGVWLTSSLNWSLQVDSVSNIAKKKTGVLYRKFYNASTSTKRYLYLTCIRPHLEYGSYCMWDLYQTGLIHTLEMVQMFALRVCTKNWNSADYESLLVSCNVTSLASRRFFLKLCVLYQIVHQLYNYFSMQPCCKSYST